MSKGFTRLADVEDTTITSAPGGVLMPVLIRTLLSRDGTVMAALYHPRIKPLLVRVLLWLLRRSPGKVVDMETECSDGSFVVTSNAVTAEAIDLPALISAEYQPAKTSAFSLHSRHVTRVAEHLAQRTGVTAKVITTHEELVASQNRMNAIKAAYRGDVGGITREELDRLAVFGTSLTRDVHDAVTREQLKRAG
ncbi:MAG: hypothetical protein U5K74_03025 [Gemmatimonadaceae bacterium]|nr:hypothetical protein [Gemmatimonadaceae bacterium]